MTQNTYYKRRVLTAVNKTPAILHVNRESRAEGLNVYLPVFGTRLRHPVWFNFSKDFLVFDGRLPDWDFLLFMNVADERSSTHSEPERQMLHTELRNLVLCDSYSTACRRELFEFCNLKNLIPPSLDAFPTKILDMQIQWARKKVGAQRSETFLSNMHTYNETKIHQANEYFLQLRELAKSKGLRPTYTKIKCWHTGMRDTFVAQYQYKRRSSFNRNPYTDTGALKKVVKDETLTQILDVCRAPIHQQIKGYGNPSFTSFSVM